MRTLMVLTASALAFTSYGQACFNPPEYYSTLASPVRLYAGDMNNDGFKDLVTSNILGLGVHLNAGNGEFKVIKTDTAAMNQSPSRLALLDVDGDGYLDVAAIRNNTLFINLNDGAGGLQAAVATTITSAGEVMAADFNEDGKADLAVNGTSLRVLFGSTAGLSAPAVFSGHAGLMTVADFNADGHSDVAAAASTASVLNVWYGNGTGGFSAPASFTAEVKIYALSPIDLNADGKSDLVISAGPLGVMLATGSNSFITLPTVSLGYICMGEVAGADINGDGRMDLVTPRLGSPNICVPVGDGTGQFSTLLQFKAGKNDGSGGVVAADFNNNGKTDIASLHQYDLSILMDCQTIGFREETAQRTLIFPNPAADLISIQTTSPVEQVTIFDVQGKEQYCARGEVPAQLNLSMLPPGCYFLQINVNGQMSQHKLIIAR